MPLPKIEFQVVAKDIEGFLKSLNSISDASKTTNLKILQAREKLSLNIKHLQENEAKDAITMDDRVLQMKEQHMLKERHLLMNDYAQKKHMGEEHYNWTSRLMSRYAALRVGSLIGGLGGGRGGMIGRSMGMAGGAAFGMPGALGFGALGLGLGLAGSAIGDAFSAVGRLGGARGLTDSLLETGENEKIFQVARMRATASQRVGMLTMQERAFQLSENPELGSFKAGDWGKTFGTLATKGGRQRDFFSNPKVFESIGRLAHISGETPEVIGDAFVRILNTGASIPDAINLLNRSFAVGQEGNFSPEAIAHSSKLLGAVTSMGGDKDENIKTAFAIQQSMMTMGLNPTVAGTALSRFKTFLASHPGAYGSKLDAAGNVSNISEAVANYAATPSDKLMKGTSIGPMLQMHDAIAVSAKNMGESSKEWIEDQKKIHLTDEEIIQMSNESITTSERLQASFNKLADAVGPTLIAGIQENMPTIQKVILQFVAHLPGIIDDLTHFGGAMMQVVDYLERHGIIDKPVNLGGEFEKYRKPFAISEGQEGAFIKQVDDAAVFADRNPKLKKELTEILGHEPSNKEAQELIGGLLSRQLGKDFPRMTTEDAPPEVILKEIKIVLENILEVNMESKEAGRRDNSGDVTPGHGTGTRERSAPQFTPFTRARVRFNKDNN